MFQTQRPSDCTNRQTIHVWNICMGVVLFEGQCGQICQSHGCCGYIYITIYIDIRLYIYMFMLLRNHNRPHRLLQERQRKVVHVQANTPDDA